MPGRASGEYRPLSELFPAEQGAAIGLLMPFVHGKRYLEHGVCFVRSGQLSIGYTHHALTELYQSLTATAPDHLYWRTQLVLHKGQITLELSPTHGAVWYVAGSFRLEQPMLPEPSNPPTRPPTQPPIVNRAPTTEKRWLGVILSWDEPLKTIDRQQVTAQQYLERWQSDRNFRTVELAAIHPIECVDAELATAFVLGDVINRRVAFQIYQHMLDCNACFCLLLPYLDAYRHIERLPETEETRLVFRGEAETELARFLHANWRG